MKRLDLIMLGVWGQGEKTLLFLAIKHQEDDFEKPEFVLL